MTAEKRASDGQRGCPVEVWDGPYRMRCSLGAKSGVCAYHGPFDQPPDKPDAEDRP